MFRAIVIISVLFLYDYGTAQQYTIKFASIAPDGSAWLNTMKEYDAAIRKESGGKLGFRIYPNGVQGEDKDVLRKIRLGQLQSAGLTGFGLGEIAPPLRVLDSPFLFESYAEVDHIFNTFEPEFRKELEDGGFVLLGWAEVGFVHIFTNAPVAKREDMRGVKMWMWEGDPIAEATFKAFGISPIPLSVIDVLTSLQTGLINGAYASPLGAIALQWHTRVKYMTEFPLADASGAVVISKKFFDSLPSDLQEILLRNGRKYLTEILTKRTRGENARSIDVLKKQGVQVTKIASENERREYVAAGKKARQSLVGKLYDQAFLDRVEKAVTDYRAQHSASK